MCTLHRASNVDDPTVLRRVCWARSRASPRDLPVVFPVHPRTRKMLAEQGLRHGWSAAGPDARGAAGLPRVPRADRRRRALVLTDSGGLQEETTALGVPCLTLRENTERPITVEEGTNVLVGTDPERIRRGRASASSTARASSGRVPELWDGRAAERIAELYEQVLGASPKELRASA